MLREGVTAGDGPAESARSGDGEADARLREAKQLAREKRHTGPGRGPDADRQDDGEDGGARSDEEGRAPGEKAPPDNRPGGEQDGDSSGKKGDEPAEAEQESTLKRGVGFVRRHPVGSAVTAVALLAVLVAALLWYLNARHFESTDDAFVDARSFSLAPKVGGYVTAVSVTDNQHVEAGTPIAQIDERDYRVALQQAQAQVAAAVASIRSADAQIAAGRAQVEQQQAQVRQAEANLAFAADENARALELVEKGAGTLQRAQQTASQKQQAQASVAQARAALDAADRQVNVQQAQLASAQASLEQAKAQEAQAQLNLGYTKVTAAQAGRVVRLTGAVGQLAQAGQAIAMFVPDELWVTANFKETQLTDMRPGQPVEMTIDAYPGRTLTGRVASVQPGSGTVFSLLPAQNATGNYVKVVQRVPTKIVFDKLPEDVTIGPGMSVVPSVRVR